jgi:hypothetical protein
LTATREWIGKKQKLHYPVVPSMQVASLILIIGPVRRAIGTATGAIFRITPPSIRVFSPETGRGPESQTSGEVRHRTISGPYAKVS